MVQIKSQIIEIEVGKIKPNPFKKYIDDGKLSQEIIEGLIEGFKQTTFHDNLAGRYNKTGEIELIYGHHRLEAVKRCYGKNYKISLKVYSYNEFSDEKMLIDMVRENVTQRGHDFKDMLHSVLLVKKWLDGTLLNAKAKPKVLTFAEIARFISKSSKSFSPEQVGRYLDIEENLDKEIQKDVVIGDRGGHVQSGQIGLEMAFHLSKAEKEDQPYLLAQIKKNGINKVKARELIMAYRRSNDETKKQVKKGKLSLNEVPIENMKKEIKKNQEDRKTKSAGQIKIISYKKYFDEASGRVGEANTEIFKACALLHGLEQSGILYELEWDKVSEILELARRRSAEYSKFIDKIIDKMDK